MRLNDYKNLSIGIQFSEKPVIITKKMQELLKKAQDAKAVSD
jgi:hypothetical protein